MGIADFFNPAMNAVKLCHPMSGLEIKDEKSFVRSLFSSALMNLTYNANEERNMVIASSLFRFALLTKGLQLEKQPGK